MHPRVDGYPAGGRHRRRGRRYDGDGTAAGPRLWPLGGGDPPALGPYRLLGRLGAGGMGRIYLGRVAGARWSR